jgi:hypothetical protein
MVAEIGVLLEFVAVKTKFPIPAACKPIAGFEFDQLNVKPGTLPKKEETKLAVTSSPAQTVKEATGSTVGVGLIKYANDTEGPVHVAPFSDKTGIIVIGTDNTLFVELIAV